MEAWETLLVFLAVEFLPPLRRAGRGGRWARVGLAALLGLLSFTLVLVLFAWLGSRLQFVFGSLYAHAALPTGKLQSIWQENQPAVLAELFLRNLAPRLRACYSSDPVVCRIAAVCDPMSTGWVLPLSCALAALLISAGLAWRLTRSRQPDR